MFIVDCMGRSGGLALLWGDKVHMEIQNFSQCHINGLVKNSEGEEPWKFIGFYGHPEVPKQHEAWALLRYLARLTPIPWVCIGDFNEVVVQFEKWGGRGRPSSQMVAFQQTLEYCEFSDLGY